MFNADNGLLKWDSDFLINNPMFQSSNTIYQQTKEFIILFQIIDHPLDNKQPICYYVVNGWTLQNSNYICCSLCSIFEATSKRIISPNKKDNHSLCDKCAIEWSTTTITRQINNLYITNNDHVNAYYLDEYNSITYRRIIVSIEKYTYVNISDYVVLDHMCQLCIPYMTYLDEISPGEDEYICSQCLNYSKQLLIDKYYPKYMNIIQILDDSSSVIVNCLIDIIISK